MALMVAETIMSSMVKYSGVDYCIAGVYLATIWEKYRLCREDICRLMLRKRSNRGRKSTINSKELSGPIPRKGKGSSTNIGEKQDEDELLEEENISQNWEVYRGEYT